MVLVCSLLAVAIGCALKFGLAPGEPALKSNADSVAAAAGSPTPAVAPSGTMSSNSGPVAQATVDPQVGVVTAVVPNIHSAAEFSALTADVLRALPQLKALQGLNDEAVHNTPDIIREAGVALGQVAQLVHDNPAYEEAGVRFYDECTLQGGGINSIRALCYANLKRLSTKLKLPLEEEKYPADVRRLAAHILDE